jgi:hypothetical protein
VLPHWHDITIPKYKLQQLLQQAGCAEHHIEQDLSQLLCHSLLSRDPRVEDSYVFTLPNMGKLVKQVVAGGGSCCCTCCRSAAAVLLGLLLGLQSYHALSDVPGEQHPRITSAITHMFHLLASHPGARLSPSVHH